jgi:hypothetical protein
LNWQPSKFTGAERGPISVAEFSIKDAKKAASQGRMSVAA